MSEFMSTVNEAWTTDCANTFKKRNIIAGK